MGSDHIVQFHANSSSNEPFFLIFYDKPLTGISCASTSSFIISYLNIFRNRKECHWSPSGLHFCQVEWKIETWSQREVCSLLWTFKQGCGCCAWSVQNCFYLSVLLEISVNNLDFLIH